MERTWYGRLILIVGLTGLALWVAAPSFIYLTTDAQCRRSKDCLEKAIPDWLPKSRINFGIDLQGGLHLVMGVQADKALLNRTDRVADEIVAELKEKGVEVEKARREVEAPEIEIVLKSADDYPKLKEVLEGRGDAWEVRAHTGASAVYAMTEDYAKRLGADAVDQAIKTLRNRIDKYGVTEPEVRKRGNDAVLIQIAGLTADEEESVKEEIIGKTAQLEFKLADDESKYFAEIAEKGLPEGVELRSDSYRGEGDALVVSPYLWSEDKNKLSEFTTQNPPPADRVVKYGRLEETETKATWRTWLLGRHTPLTGDSLVNAFVSFNSDKNQYYVAMNLDRSGARIFEDFTGANVKKRMAIVLDDIVDSAPVIQSKIPGGNVSIELGGFKNQQEILDDARKLTIVLNAGALPAPVYPQEQRTVGATLGDDAVNKGKQALLAAAVLITLLMVFYYRLSGAISILALGLNLLLLFATLAGLGATLTLPGLAGLALTIGMAVDANIIQFERIRDELLLGKTARAAVDSGFDKAFSAIFDSNVTTLLACIVLYQYGSGPIRGFATTLGVGVIINTFAAVVIPRLCFDFLTKGRRVQELSI